MTTTQRAGLTWDTMTANEQQIAVAAIAVRDKLAATNHHLTRETLDIACGATTGRVVFTPVDVNCPACLAKQSRYYPYADTAAS